MCESFFTTVKRELLVRVRYAGRAEARSSLFDYMEVFYNRQRKHSATTFPSRTNGNAARRSPPHTRKLPIAAGSLQPGLSNMGLSMDRSPS